MSYFFRFLYTLFIAIDANFKLKNKDWGIKDIELSPGGGCFVETEPYEEHLEVYGVKAPEVCRYVPFFFILTDMMLYPGLPAQHMSFRSRGNLSGKSLHSRLQG